MSLKSWMARPIRQATGYYRLESQLAELRKCLQPANLVGEAQDRDTAGLITSVEKAKLGNKRYITLLEYRPGIKTTVMPPSLAYLEKTNGTLVAQDCALRTDENGFMVSKRPSKDGDGKILLLGGSAIENLYIPEEKRIAEGIEGRN